MSLIIDNNTGCVPAGLPEHVGKHAAIIMIVNNGGGKPLTGTTPICLCWTLRPEQKSWFQQGHSQIF